ncbi:hypothetical protein NDS46_30185 (plasmid) [Paenibacillus thiaminolyticus]|uniref:hypothetical protein n=1 Tax=Paenibacillus thiaminolyticus TaxID=49283 RepID=UPI0023312FC1|nr:hypothetical protein [Paenibacillus thiaminolyticus]WCF11617.1 hypothetical protein NDS46_30185 [Paenibacillus thiaminolyticus]
MNTIIINGQRIQVSGKSISITNDSVLVDGQPVKNDLSGIVQVVFEGDLGTLFSSSNVIVNGNVHRDIIADGSVSCSYVGKNIDAGGSVSCGDVKGNVTAGGAVKCKNVYGNVKGGGNPQ